MKPAVMIDIETFDTAATAVILSIGAVRMDMESLSVIPDQVFYVEVDAQKQVQLGRTRSKDTIDWWLQQGGCPCKGEVELLFALQNLADWIEPDTEIWCKGTDFDTQILGNAYKQLYLQVPWKYNAVRDCRTIFKTFKIDWPTANTHNALEDAKNQATQLMDILKGLFHGF